MAAPTLISTGTGQDPLGMITAPASGGTNASVGLNPSLQYLVQHNGVDSSGSAVTDDVWVGDVVLTGFAGADAPGVFRVLNRASIVVGPGIKTLYLLSTHASNTPQVSIAAIHKPVNR